MPRDGSGQYALPQPPFTSGSIISSSAVNSDLSDIAAALTGSVARDGQAAMTGPLNMGNFKVTNLATPTVSTDAATKAYADTMVPLAGGTMTGLLTLSADPSAALGAATKQYADAAPNAKITPLYGVATPGTDLPVGTGSAVNYLDIILPDGVSDFIVTGLIYVQQTVASANTAFVRVAQLDSGLSSLQAADPIGLANVQGVAIPTAPFLWAATSTNVSSSRLRFYGYKDAANGPFNLVRIQAAVLAVTR